MMYIKAITYFILPFVNLLLAVIKAYPNGDIPLSSCSDMIPQHSVSPQTPSSNPYSIEVPFETYLPGKNITITLKGTTFGELVPFRGYYVQGRTLVDDQSVGIFNISKSDESAIHSCPSKIEKLSCNSKAWTDKEMASLRNTISHTSHWRSNPGPILEVNWTAPFSRSKIYFKGTFVQSYSEFWTDVISPIVSPLPHYNLTECCKRESQISSSVESFCFELQNESKSTAPSAKKTFNNLLANTTENHGLFLALRCLHWSNSSKQSDRNKIKECCREADVSGRCSRFCDGETYASWDGYQLFSKSFADCSLSYEAIVSCILVPMTTPLPYPNDAVVYTIVTTLLGSFSTQAINSLERNLIIPAMSSLTGYYSIKHINEEIRSNNFVVTTEAIFVAVTFNATNRFSFPFIQEVESNMFAQAMALNFLLPSDNDTLVPFSVDWKSGIKHKVNGITGGCAVMRCAAVLQYEIACVDIGTTGGACLCVASNGSELYCEEAPDTTPSSQQYPDRAVVYKTLTSILESFTIAQTGDRIADLLENNLIVPAMSTLPGYHSLKWIGTTYQSEKLIVTTEVVFMATYSTTDSRYTFPFIQDVKRRLTARAIAIEFTLPATDEATAVKFSSEINVSHKTDPRAGCSVSFFAPPPPGFDGLCIDIIGTGDAVFLCIDSDGTELHCDDIPLSTLPTTTTFSTLSAVPKLHHNSVLYWIESTIDFTPTSAQQKIDLNKALEVSLLIPVLSNIEGYYRIRKVKDRAGSLIITSEAEFFARDDLENGVEVPSLSVIEKALKQRTIELNYNLPVSSIASNSVDLRSNFDVTRQRTNGFCGDKACPTPPADYTSTCVEIGPSSFHCLCTHVDDGLEQDCEKLGFPTDSMPSSQLYPTDAVIYKVIVTILGFSAIDNEAQPIKALENNLIVPAMSTLPGYHSFQRVADEQESRNLVVTLEVIFIASRVPVGELKLKFTFPFIQDVKRNLFGKAESINYLLPGEEQASSYLFDSEIGVSHKNDLIASCAVSRFAAPPEGFDGVCVDIGSGNAAFLCVYEDGTEIYCNDIPDEHSLTTAGKVGIALGVLTLVAILLLIAACFWKRGKAKKKNKPTIYEGYINPSTLTTKKSVQTSVEPMYMEIKPKEGSLYTKEGEYLDITKAHCIRVIDKNESSVYENDKVLLKSDGGYEIPLKTSPALPRNHPSRDVASAYVKIRGNPIVHPESSKNDSRLQMKKDQDGQMTSSSSKENNEKRERKVTPEIRTVPHSDDEDYNLVKMQKASADYEVKHSQKSAYHPTPMLERTSERSEASSYAFADAMEKL